MYIYIYLEQKQIDNTLYYLFEQIDNTLSVWAQDNPQERPTGHRALCSPDQDQNPLTVSSLL